MLASAYRKFSLHVSITTKGVQETVTKQQLLRGSTHHSMFPLDGSALEQTKAPCGLAT